MDDPVNDRRIPAPGLRDTFRRALYVPVPRMLSEIQAEEYRLARIAGYDRTFLRQLGEVQDLEVRAFQKGVREGLARERQA